MEKERSIIFNKLGLSLTKYQILATKYYKKGTKMSENTIENDLRILDIQQLINQLKEEDRQIIILYYWWGYKDAEIGEMLSLSQQVVNYQRKKAIRIIKEEISQSCMINSKSSGDIDSKII